MKKEEKGFCTGTSRRSFQVRVLCTFFKSILSFTADSVFFPCKLVRLYNKDEKELKESVCVFFFFSRQADTSLSLRSPHRCRFFSTFFPCRSHFTLFLKKKKKLSFSLLPPFLLCLFKLYHPCTFQKGRGRRVAPYRRHFLLPTFSLFFTCPFRFFFAVSPAALPSPLSLDSAFFFFLLLRLDHIHNNQKKKKEEP